jgi:predicted nucleotidyltransferase
VLLGLILYGSRARGDFRLRSDVDIMGLSEDGRIYIDKSRRGVNLHVYTYKYMTNKAETGDLFALHIVSEGKILHDTFGLIERLTDSFVYKKSYRPEIVESSAIIWYFISRTPKLENIRARKRFVWALRTLIIASAAELRKPIFGSGDLERFSDIPDLKGIIDRRKTVDPRLLAKVGKHAVSKFGVTEEELGSSRRRRLADALKIRVQDLYPD